MRHTCERPVTWEMWVSYFAAELAEEEETRVEEQLFSCASCAREAQVLSALIESLGRIAPSVLDDEAFQLLSNKGAISRIVSVDPDGLLRVPFESGTDLVVCELRGDFARHPRVDVELLMSRKNERLLLPNMNVRADGGAVWLACQVHNVQEYGERGQITIRPTGGNGSALARYDLVHELRGH